MTNGVDWLGDNAAGVGVMIGLLTLAGGAFSFLYKEVIRPRKAGAADGAAGTVVVQLGVKQIVDAVRAELDSVAIRRPDRPLPASGGAVEPSLLDAVEQLSALRQRLRPPPLAPELFPDDLDVLEFDEGRLIMRLRKSRSGRLFGILFGLVWYTAVFAGMAAIFFGQWPYGAAAGLALFLWMSRRGDYVRIDRRNRKYRIITPVAMAFGKVPPPVELSSRFRDNAWHTTLTVAGVPVVERRCADRQPHADLKTFGHSLQWEMGGQVEVADGVFISPERAVRNEPASGPARPASRRGW